MKIDEFFQGKDTLRHARIKNCETEFSWIDNYDAMKMLHVSQRTMQTLRSTGRLPYSRVGSKVYYKMADIERMLENAYNGKGTCSDAINHISISDCNSDDNLNGKES